MESIIFKNTTSIGIRRQRMERTVLDREIVTIKTKYGPVQFKVSSFEDEKYYYPEYEDIREICNRTSLSFEGVFHEVKSTVYCKN